MHHYYTDGQIFSVGILFLFLLLLLFRVWRFFAASSSRRYLKRFKSIKRLKKLDWDAFEHLCRLLFEEEGWRVTENEKKGADGGVDLWMKRRGTKAIVQCKKYEDARVTIKVIREMYGLMYEYNTDEAFVVTTSEFTKECYRFAEDKAITLINGEMLLKRIRSV
ncbi:MAG: restriction endonuclease [Sulfurovum sp.]|nr:restriction endonuclease [Sulfurovum sp.]